MIAFEADVWPLRDRLRRHIYYRMQDRDATDDVLQDTMIAAARSLRSYRGSSSVYTWLCGVANNHIASYWRGVQRVRAIADRATRQAAHDRRMAARRPVEERAERDAELAQVAQAMQELPDRHRRALLGRLAGLSRAELREQEGMSEDAMRHMLEYSRQAVAQWVADPDSCPRAQQERLQAEMCALSQQGLTVGEIAARVGICETTARKYLRAGGVEPVLMYQARRQEQRAARERRAPRRMAVQKPQGPSRSERMRDRRRRAWALHREGVGVEEIARRLGVTRQTIWTDLQAQGA